MKPQENPRIEARPSSALWVLLSVGDIVPLGLATKFYAGPGANWVQGHLGGVLYVIFWCLVLRLLLPRARASRIALVVLVATFALEFSQLWHPPLLEGLGGTFVGRTVLGDTFAWSDFPYYVIGAALGGRGACVGAFMRRARAGAGGAAVRAVGR